MAKRQGFLVSVMVFALVTAGVFINFALSEEETDIPSQELFEEVQIFADAVTLITADYVEPVNSKDLIYGAIIGMVNTLDGYSQFLDPDGFIEMKEETRGQFGGLGMEIGMRKGVLTVIAPIDGTPAFKAGVKAGDMIVKIEDEITRGINTHEAIKKLRGEPGTKITITVFREKTGKMIDFTITRDIIKLKSLKVVKMIEDNIGYMKLIEFQERTASDMERAIKDLKKDGAENMILDLRNNPGGLLDSAVETSEYFLEKGDLIVYTEGRDPRRRVEFRAQKECLTKGMGVIVIVDGGSASAAEILAGAIMDNKKGLVLGERTFGKGSVQTVVPLNDDSALRLTTAAYYTPSGKSLMEKGIEPDIKVEGKLINEKLPEDRDIFDDIEENGTEKDRESADEDGAGWWQKDAQISAAVNILKGVRAFEKCRSFHRGDK